MATTPPQFTPLSIPIQSLEDLSAGRLLFPTVAQEGDAQVLTLHDVGILEAGTASGRTSVMLRLTDAAGNQYVAQTTARLFTVAANAVRGAQERFGDAQ